MPLEVHEGEVLGLIGRNGEGCVRQTGVTGELVSAYEACMASPERTGSDNEFAQKQGARFLSWGLDGSPNSPHTIYRPGPVRVRFVLEVHTAVRYGHHGITLYNAERQIVWGWAVDNLFFAQGVYELVCEFPYLPLRPGPYSWMLSLWSDGQNVDVWEAVPDLVIGTDNYQHSRDEWNGYLNVPSTFTWTAR